MFRMMTFITREGEGQGKTNKKRKATNSKGRDLEEGASRETCADVKKFVRCIKTGISKKKFGKVLWSAFTQARTGDLPRVRRTD